ncbi:STAS domain-containing protein [Pseudenhygromyxa sp. WMMC2535]|uniref:STAS domain-containing protein n=1 Tax=Pseudenhygromyxa sp. WMMC2535 TaxID=2712867 RepID=UPI001552BA57|nr:STAS domain-containing protein [Pseudenhygromyxa sp. WMMC2535]NVB43227.1 STAS domain-containing protein [Pseudenhygromyxa sp. WMMC2535]
MSTSCEDCPLRADQADQAPSARAVVAALRRCPSCPHLREPSPAAAQRLAACVLELDRERSQACGELARVQSERRELVLEAEAFERRLRELERLHRASSRELETQLELVRHQRDEIRRLSTPLIEVGEGALALPVIGTLDHERSAAMTQALLARVHEHKIRRVIVDVTGLGGVDPQTIQHMLHMLGSLRLLGVRVLVCGFSPALAQLLVARDIPFEGIELVRNMKEALSRIAARKRSSPSLRAPR